ncbi:MAG: oligosaccharide flippase family protein [bacterium]|nr:oligosaccharide flippase family protein [bacterium]
MASKKLSFFLGAAVDLMGIPVTMFLSFVMVPLYLRHIEAAEFGYWSATLEATQFASLLWISFDYFLIQSVSGKIDQPEELSQDLSESVVVVLIWASLSVLLVALVVWVHPQLLEQIGFQAFSGLISLMALWAVLRSLRHLLTSCLIGQNRMPLVNGIGLLGTALFQVLPYVYLQFGWGLLSFGLGYLSAFVLLLSLEASQVGGFFLAHFKPQLVRLSGVKSLLGFSFQTFTSKFSQHAYTYINIFVIAQLLGAAAIAVYVLSLKLTNFSKFIVPRISAIGFPSYARLLAEGNLERMGEVLLKLYRFSLRFGLLLSGSIFFLNGVFVAHWVGAEQYAGFTFTLLAAAFCFKESLVAIFYQTVFATREITWANRVIVFEALLNLGLAYVMGQYWGVTGVLAATLISTGLASTSYLVFKSLQLAGLRLSDLITTSPAVLLKSLPSLAALYGGAWLLELQFDWWLLIATVALAGLLNLLFFEARLAFELRHLGPKEILKEMIERS